MEQHEEELEEAKHVVVKTRILRLESKLERQVDKMNRLKKYVTATTLKLNIKGFFYLHLSTSLIALCAGLTLILLGAGIGFGTSEYDLYYASDSVLLLGAVIKMSIICLKGVGIILVVGSGLFFISSIPFYKKLLLLLLTMELSEIERTKEEITNVLKEEK